MTNTKRTLVLRRGHSLWVIEIKLTTNPGERDMQRIRKVAAMLGAERTILISQVREPLDTGELTSCDLDWFLDSLGALEA